MTTDAPDLSRAALEAHARYYEDWARDIRRHGGRSVDADYADAIAATLRALAARVVELEAALRAIAAHGDNCGCHQATFINIARAALETPNAD